jgi:triphosphoribosyl-dephospho-CoA synthase
VTAAVAPARREAPGTDPWAIDRAALDALHEELDLSPKPGLVTPRDRGAHADMDHATFAASLRALRGTFGAAARAGMARAPFAALRALGVDAEARMLAATRGVNTHRGAIFTLGLLAAAAGRLAAAGARCEPWALRDAIRRAYASSLRALPAPGDTHGAEVARRHGAGGARAEAVAGFPHLFQVALPAYAHALKRGAGTRAAAVQCLMSIIAVLLDTNLLHRGGPSGLAFAQSAASGFLRAGGVERADWEEHAREIHVGFVARRLSPGGSADLLAATLFVLRLGGDGRA